PPQMQIENRAPTQPTELNSQIATPPGCSTTPSPLYSPSCLRADVPLGKSDFGPGAPIENGSPHLKLSMVDYNLINSLGNLDEEVNSAVATALGDAATDLNKLVKSDEVQDFVPGNILKGRIGSIIGDDFVVEMG